MNFTSVSFLFMFLPIFLVLYYLLPNNNIKNIFLLLSSLYFYSAGEPVFVFFIIISIIFNYIIAKQIHNTRDEKIKKIFLIINLVFNFGVLAVFKYTNFLISTINALFTTNIPLTKIPLPIGISFFTFQVVSYILDVYYDNAMNDSKHYQKNIFSFALYITMFMQLVAGPIVRYSDISHQIKKRKFDINEVNYGLKRFIYGLSKKVLIANTMAIVADKAFSTDGLDLGSSFLFLGAFSYMLQIYFDFSGYSDMAIGIGRIIGFTFPENFNFPYKAVSITDFWRRWHITLSSWFKDYLYIPLGGSKYEYKTTIRNLFIVWFFTGLWHGAKWTFVLWGLCYFAFLTFEKYFKQKNKVSIEEKLPYIVCRFYTIFVVMLIWIFFRADSIRQAFLYIYNMFNFSNRGLVNSQALFYIKEYFLFYLIAILSSLKVFYNFPKVFFNDENDKVYVILSNLLSAFLLVICTVYIVKGSYNPFIYFNF